MKTGDSSSRRILKSTAIVGGSNLIVALIRIGQMKIFAILLGPVGVGLIGFYYSIMGTTVTLSGLGIGSSGVRQISEATSSGNERMVATARFTLRWLTLALGITGALVLFLLRTTVSRWVFHQPGYGPAIGVLSLGVLFAILSGSQVAVLTGLRRIKEIARINVVGSAIGTSLAVLLVWLWREQGLVYAIVSATLATLICSWWFVRRLPPPQLKPSSGEMRAESRTLLGLGVTFVFAGLVLATALLCTRVIILDRLGMASAGYFQAGWGIVVFYIDFILTAMGVDFYPHLASRIRDQKSANKLVNEQTEVALLLGGPLILGMLLFAPALILIFYSAKFGAATTLLRWLLVGNILKVIAWPMGYLLMAHAWAWTFACAEIVWITSYLALVYFGIGFFGIEAAGYAFVGSYLSYTAFLYFVVRRFCRFSWSPTNLRLIVVLSAAAGLVLVLVLEAGIAGYCIGAVITLGIGIYSLRRLFRMADNESARRIVQMIQRKLFFRSLTNG